MTEPKSTTHQLTLRIPDIMWQRIEEEKERRRIAGRASRPEATSVILEAIDVYLGSIEKKITR